MDCIEWSKAKNHLGYGVLCRDGKQYKAHRVAYCDYHNIGISSIAGKVVRHTCDNRSCVNPKHLLLGTQTDNMQDAVERGRMSRGTAHHMVELTEDQIDSIRTEYVYRSKVSGSVALARKYGVHKSTIQRIVRGITHQAV